MSARITLHDAPGCRREKIDSPTTLSTLNNELCSGIPSSLLGGFDKVVVNATVGQFSCFSAYLRSGGIQSVEVQLTTSIEVNRQRIKNACHSTRARRSFCLQFNPAFQIFLIGGHSWFLADAKAFAVEQLTFNRPQYKFNHTPALIDLALLTDSPN